MTNPTPTDPRIETIREALNIHLSSPTIAEIDLQEEALTALTSLAADLAAAREAGRNEGLEEAAVFVEKHYMNGASYKLVAIKNTGHTAKNGSRVQYAKGIRALIKSTSEGEG